MSYLFDDKRKILLTFAEAARFFPGVSGESTGDDLRKLGLYPAEMNEPPSVELPQFAQMAGWEKAGIKYVRKWEIVTLSAERAEQKRKEASENRVREAKIQAQQYLKDTDWYVLRKAETGTPIPQDVSIKRSQAREVLAS